MNLRFHQLCGAIVAWRRDVRGGAAAEFALLLTLLAIPVLNVVDLGIYGYQRMELDNAAQVGAQAAWAIVPHCTLPLTVGSNCTSLTSKISTAVQSTPLGTKVTVTSVENYYCVNSAGNLVVVGTLQSKPSNCSSVGVPTGTPGDYILVTTSYTYTPVFSAVSIWNNVLKNFNPITRAAWMRLG